MANFGELEPSVFTYRARLHTALDGARFDMLLDIGFETRRVQRVRLDGVYVWGLNAPVGHRLSSAIAARTYVEQKLDDAPEIKVVSKRKENDLYFADIFYLSKHGKWKNLATQLLKKGLASRTKVAANAS